jgi:hypothetical protein
LRESAEEFSIFDWMGLTILNLEGRKAGKVGGKMRIGRGLSGLGQGYGI